MLERDVLVVGAGPAGLMAARKATERGASTLLLEKGRALGVKACAEAVSRGGLTDAELPPSPKLVDNTVRGVHVYPPSEKRMVDIESSELGHGEGYVLDKISFLREMAAQAAEKGSEIWVNSELLEVRPEEGAFKALVRKMGERVTVRARVLLGCDGVNSVVARRFFPREGYTLVSCLQYKMVNCHLEDAHILHTYVGHKVAPMGYAWIFPKDERTANVGIGVRGVPAKPYLDNFISRHPQTFGKAKIVEVQAAPVPVSGQINKVAEGGVAICGDAAGQVIPLTGGGIRTSLVSGKMAAEVAAEQLSSSTSQVDLFEYQKRYGVYWGRRIANSLTALRLVERLTDEELELLAETLTGQDIVDLAAGMDIERVGKKLLQHPQFASSLARALIGG